MAKAMEHIGRLRTLTGVVRDFSYKSEGFNVVKIIPDVSDERCRDIVIDTDKVEPNRHYEFIGHVADYKGRPSFQAVAFRETLPRKSWQLHSFLFKGGLDGMRKDTVDRLIDKYGDRAINVIEEMPEKLRELTGSEKEFNDIMESLKRFQKDPDDPVMKLKENGVPSYVIDQLLKIYGSSLLEVIRMNPYDPISKVRGYGFATAERLAKDTSMKKDSQERIIAGLSYTLTNLCDNSGHTFIPLITLVEEASGSGILGIEQDKVRETLLDYISKNPEKCPFVIEDNRVYTRRLYENENEIADAIYEIVSKNHPEQASVVSTAELERINGVKYAPEQAAAIAMAQRNDFVIITGGPGTGKTTTLKGVVQALHMQGKESIKVLAPTGLATTRAKDSIGEVAPVTFSTVHRALGFDGENYGAGKDSPLDADVVIVDETSMMDVNLAAALFRARKPGCKIIFVGDADQLPSVGPGSVIRNLVDVQEQDGVEIPVMRLQRVYRQGKDSPIVDAATAINAGEMPSYGTKVKENDFCFIEKKDKDIQDEIVRLIVSEIPKATGLSPLDIQVMSPLKNERKAAPHDPLCTKNLNKKLQSALNPRGESVVHHGTTFRIGDRVMNQVNNYSICEEGLINGQQGTVIDVAGPKPVSVTVQFKGIDEPVTMSGEDLDHLELAYAVTVHKSQGSEYPVVIMPMAEGLKWFTDKSIFYTWITRGKNLAVCVGSEGAMRQAVSKDRSRDRYTTLRDRLLNRFKGLDIEPVIEINDNVHLSKDKKVNAGGIPLMYPSAEDASAFALEQYVEMLGGKEKFSFGKPVFCQNAEGRIYKGITQLLLASHLKGTRNRVPIYLTEKQLNEYGLKPLDGAKLFEPFFPIWDKTSRKLVRMHNYNIEDTNIEAVYPGLLQTLKEKCDGCAEANAGLVAEMQDAGFEDDSMKEKAYDVTGRLFMEGVLGGIRGLVKDGLDWKAVKEIDNGVKANFSSEGKDMEFLSVSLGDEIKDYLKLGKDKDESKKENETEIQEEDASRLPGND